MKESISHKFVESEKNQTESLYAKALRQEKGLIDFEMSYKQIYIEAKNLFRLLKTIRDPREILRTYQSIFEEYCRFEKRGKTLYSMFNCEFGITKDLFNFYTKSLTYYQDVLVVLGEEIQETLVKRFSYSHSHIIQGIFESLGNDVVKREKNKQIFSTVNTEVFCDFTTQLSRKTLLGDELSEEDFQKTRKIIQSIHTKIHGHVVKYLGDDMDGCVHFAYVEKHHPHYVSYNQLGHEMEIHLGRRNFHNTYAQIFGKEGELNNQFSELIDVLQSVDAVVFEPVNTENNQTIFEVKNRSDLVVYNLKDRERQFHERKRYIFSLTDREIQENFSQIAEKYLIPELEEVFSYYKEKHEDHVSRVVDIVEGVAVADIEVKSLFETIRSINELNAKDFFVSLYKTFQDSPNILRHIACQLPPIIRQVGGAGNIKGGVHCAFEHSKVVLLTPRANYYPVQHEWLHCYCQKTENAFPYYLEEGYIEDLNQTIDYNVKNSPDVSKYMNMAFNVQILKLLDARTINEYMCGYRDRKELIEIFMGHLPGKTESEVWKILQDFKKPETLVTILSEHIDFKKLIDPEKLNKTDTLTPRYKMMLVYFCWITKIFDSKFARTCADKVLIAYDHGIIQDTFMRTLAKSVVKEKPLPQVTSFSDTPGGKMKSNKKTFGVNKNLDEEEEERDPEMSRELQMHEEIRKIFLYSIKKCIDPLEEIYFLKMQFGLDNSLMNILKKEDAFLLQELFERLPYKNIHLEAFFETHFPKEYELANMCVLAPTLNRLQVIEIYNRFQTLGGEKFLIQTFKNTFSQLYDIAEKILCICKPLLPDLHNIYNNFWTESLKPNEKISGTVIENGNFIGVAISDQKEKFQRIIVSPKYVIKNSNLQFNENYNIGHVYGAGEFGESVVLYRHKYGGENVLAASDSVNLPLNIQQYMRGDVYILDYTKIYNGDAFFILTNDVSEILLYPKNTKVEIPDSLPKTFDGSFLINFDICNNKFIGAVQETDDYFAIHASEGIEYAEIEYIENLQWVYDVIIVDQKESCMKISIISHESDKEGEMLLGSPGVIIPHILSQECNSISQFLVIENNHIFGIVGEDRWGKGKQTLILPENIEFFDSSGCSFTEIRTRESNLSCVTIASDKKSLGCAMMKNGEGGLKIIATPDLKIPKVFQTWVYGYECHSMDICDGSIVVTLASNIGNHYFVMGLEPHMLGKDEHMEELTPEIRENVKYISKSVQDVLSSYKVEKQYKEIAQVFSVEAARDTMRESLKKTEKVSVKNIPKFYNIESGESLIHSTLKELSKNGFDVREYQAGDPMEYVFEKNNKLYTRYEDVRRRKTQNILIQLDSIANNTTSFINELIYSWRMITLQSRYGISREEGNYSIESFIFFHNGKLLDIIQPGSEFFPKNDAQFVDFIYSQMCRVDLKSNLQQREIDQYAFDIFTEEENQNYNERIQKVQRERILFEEGNQSSEIQWQLREGELDMIRKFTHKKNTLFVGLTEENIHEMFHLARRAKIRLANLYVFEDVKKKYAKNIDDENMRFYRAM